MVAIQGDRRLTIEEFLDLDAEVLDLYELNADGSLTEMPAPSEDHEDIVEFLRGRFTAEIARLNRAWKVRSRLIRIPPGGKKLCRKPDLMIVDAATTPEAQEAVARALYPTPHLIVEIASSNWKDDLREKLYDYQLLQVPEYWVVDYRGQIPEKYCKRGKGIKTIVFYPSQIRHTGDEYWGDEPIPCQTFPELSLTTHQIIQAVG